MYDVIAGSVTLALNTIVERHPGKATCRINSVENLGSVLVTTLLGLTHIHVMDMYIS
jgi:hypothetical protein